jgi:hypothetical protein
MESYQTNELDFPIQDEIMFTDYKGNLNKKVENKQRKLLSKIKFLKTFLDPDEKIFFVVTACSPMSGLDVFLTGIVIYNLKLCYLVFTNKRIFHIPTDVQYKYRSSIAHILYSDISNISVKSSELRVEYKSGLKEKFTRLPLGYGKKIRDLLEKISLEGIPSGNKQRTHLCPSCRKELRTDVFECSNCHLEFKSKVEGKKKSIIYPGGGYFYTGHPILGTLDAITEFTLTVFVLGAFIEIFRGVEGSLFSFVLFGIILAIEKTVSVFHSNKFLSEYIPKKKTIEVNV